MPGLSSRPPCVDQQALGGLSLIPDSGFFHLLDPGASSPYTSSRILNHAMDHVYLPYFVSF